MAQVSHNSFQVTTLRGEQFCIDLNQGLIEGCAISVLLVGLLLSRCLALLRSQPLYETLVVQFPKDNFQQEVTLKEIGWTDEWLIFSDAVEHMGAMLGLWREVLGTLGWEMNHAKTQFMCTATYPQPLVIEGFGIQPSTSLSWLGCILTESGSANEHVRHRVFLGRAAWSILLR